MKVPETFCGAARRPPSNMRVDSAFPPTILRRTDLSGISAATPTVCPTVQQEMPEAAFSTRTVFRTERKKKKPYDWMKEVIATHGESIGDARSYRRD